MEGSRDCSTSERGRAEQTRGKDEEKRRAKGRSRKSRGLPETDVAVSGLGRLIASGPLPCQALTPLSSAVIYRLRFARFKHHSVAIMAGKREDDLPEMGAELDPCSSQLPHG